VILLTNVSILFFSFRENNFAKDSSETPNGQTPNPLNRQNTAKAMRKKDGSPFINYNVNNWRNSNSSSSSDFFTKKAGSGYASHWKLNNSNNNPKGNERRNSNPSLSQILSSEQLVPQQNIPHTTLNQHEQQQKTQLGIRHSPVSIGLPFSNNLEQHRLLQAQEQCFTFSKQEEVPTNFVPKQNKQEMETHIRPVYQSEFQSECLTKQSLSTMVPYFQNMPTQEVYWMMYRECFKNFPELLVERRKTKKPERRKKITIKEILDDHT